MAGEGRMLSFTDIAGSPLEHAHGSGASSTLCTCRPFAAPADMATPSSAEPARDRFMKTLGGFLDRDRALFDL